MAAGGGLLDLYAVLGVSRDASKDNICKAYRRLALRCHPDKVDASRRPEAAEQFRELARAYEVLRDDRRRHHYDETGQYDGQVGAGSAYDAFFDSFFGDDVRASDTRSADYTYYSLSNYDRLTLKEEDLPPYMRDIVKVGLNYLAQVVEDLDCREVVFLRHQRVDILYVMLAYFPPLVQASFDDGYIIHYYDNPLQASISPAWSDQNVLGGGSGKKLNTETRSLRILNEEQFARRQDYARSALTWDPQAALEDKYWAAGDAARKPKETPLLQVAAASPGSLAESGLRPCCLPFSWCRQVLLEFLNGTKA